MKYVLYDGECPVCARYIDATGVARCRADYELIDARTRPDLVAQHRAEGRLIDEGMIVVEGEDVHFGGEATRRLAEIGVPASGGSKIMLWSVGKAPWSGVLYPILASGRRALLRVL